MIIYRYIPIEWEKRIKAPVSRQLWLSSPKDFNDPFDCNHPIETKASKGERLKVISGIIGKDASELSAHPAVSENLMEQARVYIDDKFSKTGICCFSERWDSILMWSHYSDGHRGICLAYDAADLIGNSGCVFGRVRYKQTSPPIHIKDMQDEAGQRKIIGDFLLTKASDWAYEKEWRLIVFDKGGQLIKSPLSLRSVIFGLKTSRRNELKIQSMLGNEISYYKVKREGRSFNLAKEHWVGSRGRRNPEG